MTRREKRAEWFNDHIVARHRLGYKVTGESGALTTGHNPHKRIGPRWGGESGKNLNGHKPFKNRAERVKTRKNVQLSMLI